MSDTCHNPFCNNPVESGKRKPRRFCSDRCKMDTWALRRVAEMLIPLGPAEGWRVLEDLKSNGLNGKLGSPASRKCPDPPSNTPQKQTH